MWRRGRRNSPRPITGSVRDARRPRRAGGPAKVAQGPPEADAAVRVKEAQIDPAPAKGQVVADVRVHRRNRLGERRLGERRLGERRLGDRLAESAAQAEAGQHTSRGRRQGRPWSRRRGRPAHRQRREPGRLPAPPRDAPSQPARERPTSRHTHPPRRTSVVEDGGLPAGPGRPAGPDGERRPRREHGPRSRRSPFTGWRRLLFAPRIADTVPPGESRLGSPRAVKRDLHSRRAERGSPALGTGRPRTSQRKQAFAWPCA